MSIATIPAADYHADAVADVPTLSASIACILAEKTPAHAKVAHPKLNPTAEPAAPKPAWDVGTAAHALLLEGYEVAHVVEGFDNWKTNAARDERDEARANGMVPMLRREWEEVVAMVDAAHAAQPGLLADGASEVTLLWDADGVACRSRVDHLRDDFSVVLDYKTAASANPEEFKRSLFRYGYDVKAAFYLQAVKAETGVDATFRWVVQEKVPPYALSLVEPSEDTLAVGAAKVKYALQLWNECLASGEWPGYPAHVVLAEPPPWELRWLEAEVEEAAWSGL